MKNEPQRVSDCLYEQMQALARKAGYDPVPALTQD